MPASGYPTIGFTIQYSMPPAGRKQPGGTWGCCSCGASAYSCGAKPARTLQDTEGLVLLLVEHAPVAGSGCLQGRCRKA